MPARRFHLLSALLVAVLCGSVGYAPAAPPTLTNVTPHGAERGKPVEIVVAGANLTPQARLLLPFAATQELLPEPKPNPAQARFRLTIDPTVTLGPYPIRVATEDGLSPLVLFRVDALPSVNEAEENNTFERAQKVPFPIVVEGQCGGGDVDHYRFTVAKGQRVVVESEAGRLGSGVLPLLRVTDAHRRLIAADDTQAIDGDGRTWFIAAEGGDYVVEISDTRYRGGNPPFYRLRITDDEFAEELFPLGGRRGEIVEFALRGGTLSEPRRVSRKLSTDREADGMPLPLDGVLRSSGFAPRVAISDLPERVWQKSSSPEPRRLDVLPPVVVNSRLERPGDVDRFQFAVQPGQRYRIAVEAERFGSALDGVLRVLDQAGRQLTQVDDLDLPPLAQGLGPTNVVDPSTDVTVPAGVSLLVVELRDQRSRGGVNFTYRLTIEPSVGSFSVQQVLAEVNVPRGGTAVVPFTLRRTGYTGPVQVSVAELPTGFMVHGGDVPAGANAGAVTLTAVPTATLLDAPALQVRGRAMNEGRELRPPGSQMVPLSRDGTAVLSALELTSFAVGLTAAEPFAVQGPLAVEVIRGVAVPVPVAITRAAEQQALSVEVTGVVPAVPGQPPTPPQFTFAPATAAAGTTSANFNLTAAAPALDGQTLSLAVQGKAKVGNADRVVNGPAIQVTVARPFAVEVLTPLVDIAAGKSAVVKGRLRRHPLFKEAVQIKVDGLPPGVSLSPPPPVGAGAAEFQFELKAAPTAMPAAASTTLTLSATLAGSPYVHPPLTLPVQTVAPR